MNRSTFDSAANGSVRFRPLTFAVVFGLWLSPIGCAEASGTVGMATGPSVSAALAALPATAPRQPEQPHLSSDERSDIEWLRSILENPANSTQTRAGAAVRLMGIGHQRALDPLIEALRHEDDDLTIAVAVAIHEVITPPPQLLAPALEGLRTARGTTLDQLSLAITQYGAVAYAKLVEIARDQEITPEGREGAIAALGSFRTHDATNALVKLLDPEREEPTEVIHAACKALQRATGLPYGTDAAAWRQWWAEAGDQPPEQWLTNLVQRLSEQLNQAERQVVREREATGQVQQRLAQAYRELFPRLELEEQLRALPELLGDPLPTLREFAVDRIARLLRDSVRIPEDLQNKLAERLTDDVPELRLQAARLLEQMNYDGLADQMGAQLLEEENDDLIEGFLDILAKRPGAMAFSAVLPLLESPRHGERAAIALWEIVNHEHETVDEEHLAAARRFVTESELVRQSPAHTRLVARIAPDEELAELASLMDEDDVEMKQAVAEGLMRRGAAQPLLDRVSDESIYPFAARALARADSPWWGLRQLVTLPPPEAHASSWREQIMTLLGRLPPERAMEADDLLAGVSEVSVDQRIRAIQRRLNQNDNGNSMPSDVRAELTWRLAELHLQADQPQLALERLEASGDIAGDPESVALRFRAMIRLGQFDRAQQLVPEPESWIALLERWVERQPDQAAPLREEIDRRFNGQLNDDLQGQLEAVSERLPTPPTDAAPSESADADDMGEA